QATNPFNATLSISPPGASQAPTGWMGDYVVGRISPNLPANVALALHNVSLVEVYPQATLVQLRGSSSRDLQLNFGVDAQSFLIQGIVRGLAANVTLSFNAAAAGGGASWDASSTTTSLDLFGST